MWGNRYQEQKFTTKISFNAETQNTLRLEKDKDVSQYYFILTMCQKSQPMKVKDKCKDQKGRNKTVIIYRKSRNTYIVSTLIGEFSEAAG